MMMRSDTEPAHGGGKVLHNPAAYDLMLRLFWGSGERTYREQVLRLAGVGPGDRLLDIGCGTGTLAVMAKRLVGPTGRVAGIDASAEMIARARSKAGKNRLDISLAQSSADSLPFPAASFDAVLATTVLHCLPRAALASCFAEMRRVAVPRGRLLCVDFGSSGEPRHGLMSHMRRHREFDIYSVVPAIEQAGFTNIQAAPLGFGDLHYVLAS